MPSCSGGAQHACLPAGLLTHLPAPHHPTMPRLNRTTPPGQPPVPVLQCGGRLSKSFRGPAHEVFAKVLRGLSGTKLTKPGTFRDAEGTGHAVRCSYKVGEGWGAGTGEGVGGVCGGMMCV